MSRRRAARSRVLSGLAFVLVAHAGLNILVDTAKPEYRDPEFGWRAKRVAAVDRGRGGRPLVLAFGTSRVQMGFDPAAAQPDPAGPVVFNMAQAGAGPLHQLLNLKRTLDAGVKPAAVIFEILPATLAAGGPAEHVFRDTADRLAADDLPRLADYCENPATLRRKWLAARANPWHDRRFLLMSHWLPGFLPWNQRVDFQWRMMTAGGRVPYPFPEIPADYREAGIARCRAQYADILAVFHISPEADRAVRDLISLCRDRGIRVAAVVMPEGPAYAGWYSAAARGEIDRYLGTLGVRVFDTRNWLPDETAFADSHHLMPHAGTAFSVRFGAECLRPWLAGAE